jgi:hypothetical protein
MKGKPRKGPKRLFKNREPVTNARAIGGLPSWLRAPTTEQEQGIIGAHIRLPGYEAAQAKMREIFAIHRVVDPAGKRIFQIAAQLFMVEGGTQAPRYPNGVTVPSELRTEMPRLEGQQKLLIKVTRRVSWFADFDQRMCEIAMEAEGKRDRFAFG